MLLSTAMPTVIAAMVIVIISRGRLISPSGQVQVADNRFGIIPIIISLKDLNSTRNITAIITSQIREI